MHVLTARGGGQGGELQDVPDDEQQQDDAAPAHGAHGVARGEVLRARLLHGVLVTAACLLVAVPQVEGAASVREQQHHQRDAHDPQEALVGQQRLEQGPQEHRVVIVGNLALEVVGVAVSMEDDEEQEDNARPRHEALHKDSGREGGPLLLG